MKITNNTKEERMRIGQLIPGAAFLNPHNDQVGMVLSTAGPYPMIGIIYIGTGQTGRLHSDTEVIPILITELSYTTQP